jgi:hypothetical protein
MKDYKVAEAEALVIGGDGTNVHIIHVDSKGIVSNRGDISYAAIGAGAWHANTRLAQSQYTKTATFHQCVTDTFAAKKYAELMAPGVGLTTDAFIVFRDKIEPLQAEVFTECGKIYDEQYLKHRDIDRESSSRLAAVMKRYGAANHQI